VVLKTQNSIAILCFGITAITDQTSYKKSVKALRSNAFTDFLVWV
jgi:hypothetical protein